MKIQKVTDPAFRRYGQVLEGYDFTSLIKEMKHTPGSGRRNLRSFRRRTGSTGCYEGFAE